jgi:iron complex outermembrane recepter protein
MQEFLPFVGCLCVCIIFIRKSFSPRKDFIHGLKMKDQTKIKKQLFEELEALRKQLDILKMVKTKLRHLREHISNSQYRPIILDTIKDSVFLTNRQARFISKVAVCVGLSFCMALYWVGAAFALERSIYDLSLKELSEIVVTETKIAQSKETVTQKVRLLYSSELEQQTLYNRNIAELLKYTPGQFVNVLSRNDANWGSFGGLGPKYNGYLLDGLAIDSFADSMSLDPWAFDRIELHEGPASVMYSNYLSMDFAGNETPLAGITNFILKDRIDDSSTRFFLGSGSYNTLNGRFYHQNRKGDLSYFCGANSEQSDYTNYGTDNSWLNIIDDPEYKKTKLYFKTLYSIEPEKQSISLFADHTQHTGDAGRPNREFKNIYDTINAAYKNQVNDAWNIQLKAGYRHYNRSWKDDNYPANLGLKDKNAVKQNIFPADLAINYKHMGKSLLTTGIDYQAATYVTTSEENGLESTLNDMNAYNIGAYFQEKILFEKWVFRAGGRYNDTHHHYDLLNGSQPVNTSNSWGKPLWSAGVRYEVLSHMALYSNIGSSFLVPSAKQIGGTLHATDAGVAGKDGQLPNLGLKPESGIGYDLGIDLRPLDTLKIDIRGFFNQVDDAIVENVISRTPSQTKSVNAGKASSYGIEISVNHDVADELKWFANLTYTASNVENSLDYDQDGINIPFVPETIANAGITMKFPLAIIVSPYIHVVGNYYDSTSKSSRMNFGPYEVINMKLQKNLFRTDNYTMDIAIDLNNIGNKRYEMPWQFCDPGFNVFGSLDLTF